MKDHHSFNGISNVLAITVAVLSILLSGTGFVASKSKNIPLVIMVSVKIIGGELLRY